MTNPVDRSSLSRLLEAVAAGRMTPADAEKTILQTHIADLEFAAVDLHRNHRRGRAEAIFCEGKTSDQVVQIARRMAEAGQNVLMTRMSPEQQAAAAEAFRGADVMHCPAARLMGVHTQPAESRGGLVGVLAAGTSDLPVAEEAACTAEFLGSPVERAFDVGVAGLHRLLRHADLLTRARVLVVVAGMEGALPSVVSGLVASPVIAVPTSVGYGANFGGMTALLAMINGCSPGVSVVNIDNGFGAGYLADLINSLGEGPPEKTS